MKSVCVVADRTMVLGSTQPVTEMITKSISWGWRRPVRKTDKLTNILCRCHEIWETGIPEILGATPHFTQLYGNWIIFFISFDVPSFPRSHAKYRLENGSIFAPYTTLLGFQARLSPSRNPAKSCSQRAATIHASSSSSSDRGPDKSLSPPWRKQARKHVGDACNFNNLETRAVIKFFSCKAKRRRKFTPFWQKH